jgi:hypothetical protein
MNISLLKFAPACIAIALGVQLPQDVQASGPKRPPVTNLSWQSECASCHVAYPPRLLPADSWRAIMNGLDRHFGTDASLDEATATSIRTFLETNAGDDRGARSAAPVLRITETPRFTRKHRDIPEAVWRSEKVKSRGNCAACHAGADRGSFSERDARIPR